MNLLWMDAVSQSDILNEMWQAVETGDAVRFTHVREALLQTNFPLYNERMSAAEAEAHLPEDVKEELGEAWKLLFLPTDEVSNV